MSVLAAVRYKADTASGKQDLKEHILDEQDDLWVQLRHSHIADVYTTLAKRFQEFQERNKAAKYQVGGKGECMCAGCVVHKPLPLSLLLLSLLLPWLPCACCSSCCSCGWCWCWLMLHSVTGRCTCCGFPASFGIGVCCCKLLSVCRPSGHLCLLAFVWLSHMHSNVTTPVWRTTAIVCTVCILWLLASI